MPTPESHGFPEPPDNHITCGDLICNDLHDYNDGCVNSLIIAVWVTKAVTKKQTTILTIREENDSGQGEDLTLLIKLPAEYWPEDIELCQADKYALMLVRIRE